MTKPVFRFGGRDQPSSVEGLRLDEIVGRSYVLRRSLSVTCGSRDPHRVVDDCPRYIPSSVHIRICELCPYNSGFVKHEGQFAGFYDYQSICTRTSKGKKIELITW